MKKLIMTAFAALMICGLQAQDARPEKGREKMTPEKMAQFETYRMVKELKLDKETAKKVGDINLRFAKEQIAKREENKAKREDMRKQFEAKQLEKDKALEKVLSPKDFASYKKKREEMRKRMNERRGKGDKPEEFGGQRSSNDSPSKN